jgi:hypothetical protein
MAFILSNSARSSYAKQISTKMIFGITIDKYEERKESPYRFEAGQTHHEVVHRRCNRNSENSLTPSL